MAADLCLRRFLRALTLVLAVLPLVACSNTRLSPAYSPQGILTEAWHAGAPVNLVVVDRIHNTAPLPSEGSNILGVRRIARGTQLVCNGCTFELETSPTTLVQQIVTDVLALQGTTFSAAAGRKIEVQVLQFEFLVSNDASGRELRLVGRVGVHVIVSDNGVVVVDRYAVEANKPETGPIASAEEMRDEVSKTVSAAIERILSDPQVSEALSRP